MVQVESGCATSFERFAVGRRFRSVVQSDILSERPAILAIIRISRPIGIEGMLKQPGKCRSEIGDGGDLTSCECGTCVLRRSPPSPILLQVDNEAEPRRSE